MLFRSTAVVAEETPEWCMQTPFGVRELLDVAGAAVMLADRSLQPHLLRDVFGNPFRPVRAERRWLVPSVGHLANVMYSGWDFASMPVLADALEELGCDDEQILSHCRGPGPHVRGCWVVDLVLGKD